MTRLLASVANLAEARLAAECGVDIIDLKNPAAGALGALPLDMVASIAGELRGRAPLSATVGDLPMEPETVRSAVAAMAATGVDYVKLGFFPGGDWLGVIENLKSLTERKVRLVAVLFADQPFALDWLSLFAAAGFAGAMLDTADKQAGSLTGLRDVSFLSAFVNATHRQGLLCGLAGSLRVEDIEPLRQLGPDYLGFRGALCSGVRTGELNPRLVAELLTQIRTPAHV